MGTTVSAPAQPDDDPPTRAEPIRARELALPPLTREEGSGAATRAGSKLFDTDALRRERRTQQDKSFVMAAGIGIIGAAALQASRRYTPTHWAMTAALLFLAVVSLWARTELRRTEDTEGPALITVVIVGLVVNLTALAHVGVLSLVVLPLPVIVFAVAAGDTQWRATAAYSIAAAGCALVAALAYFEVVPVTKSVLAIAAPNPALVVRAAVFVELVLVLALVMARSFRASKLRAMEELAVAQQGLMLREALLKEAREDMEQFADVARVGRFTGKDVGPFVVHELLGRGGAGEVYRAVHRESGEQAALKVLYRHLRQQAGHEQSLLREAAVTSGIHSPHVVRVASTGFADDGSPYYAMELIRGGHLGQLLRVEGRLPLAEVVRVVRHACSALSVAHDRGVVHRDVKPQNLMNAGTRERPHWKVLDFGISQQAGDVTAPGADGAAGTPGYLSPEQARGDLADGRADLCSLGLVAYRALTGRPAFAGERVATVLYNAIHAMPERPSTLCSVPREVDQVLALALAKRAADRFQNAAEFAEAFEAAAAGRIQPGLAQRAERVLAALPWSEVEASRSRSAR